MTLVYKKGLFSVEKNTYLLSKPGICNRFLFNENLPYSSNE